MPEAALLIVAALFGIYGCLVSMELGVGLLRLRPTRTNSQRNQQLFTPLWEITNVFLVFGFTGFAVFFNNVLVNVSNAVFNVLALAITLLLLRACLVLYIYYRQAKLGWSWVNLLFILVSLAIPLSFATIGVYLLIGQLFWQTSGGWLLMAMALTGVLALAASFMLWVIKSTKLRNLAALLVLLFAAVGSLGCQLLLPGRLGHLTGQPFLVWTGLMNFTLLFLAAAMLARKEQWLLGWLSLVAIVSPALWAWFNQPYLIFPGTSLVAGYGAQAYGSAVLIGMAITAPVIALGLALFAKLYTNQHRF
jgi:cytochrome bd-type quinol oxidase subunit 2